MDEHAGTLIGTLSARWFVSNGDLVEIMMPG
jgi:hypothetical protein